ncbi:MAG: nickel pincer cofactor biosynthesis protein LarC [Gemmatimonadales bacterium]|nr:nickel pincer cofactor biosynthesis protein LarC [Gemmatimonadales bacterium]
MSGLRFAILDPAAGISGDMLLGALIDVGADPAWLSGLPGRLGVPEVTVTVESVSRCSVQAAKVYVVAPGGLGEAPGEPHGHLHHGQGHHQAPHRHVKALIKLIEAAQLSKRTKELASQAFRLLAEAEGRVHGLAPEKVALHEVGAYDALVDIVGAIEGLELLGLEEVYSRPVAVGSGWVRAAHGTLPVPAPATAILLEGLEVSTGGPVTGEATTPTGAALLRVLSRGTPPTAWRAVRSGWGAGDRNPEEWPNALRLIVAERAAEAARVVVLSTDLDDLSPEYLEPLREAMAEAGALDVQVWPTHMKKGRIGFRIEAIVAPEQADAVADAIFRHSTTAGLRRALVDRLTLPRREWSVPTGAGGAVRVKTLDGPGGPRTKPEYDDVLSEARRTGRPAHDLAREFHEQAGRLTRASAGEPSVRTTVPKESE